MSLKPAEVIMSDQVEAYVKSHPFRTCDHLAVRIDKMAVHRMWVCSKCGTYLMSEVECLANQNPYAGVDLVMAIKTHCERSVLVEYRGSHRRKEVTPELYEKLREQKLIDVLRFPPSGGEQTGTDLSDAMQYAAMASRAAAQAFRTKSSKFDRKNYY